LAWAEAARTFGAMARSSTGFAIVPFALLSTGALACTDDTDPTERETRGLSAPAVTSGVETCVVDGAQVRIVTADEPFTFRVKARVVTQDCRCKYTSEGCAGQRDCTSHYDLGASNPEECTTTGDVPLAVSEVSTDGNTTCEAEATIVDGAPGIVEVTARCRGPVGGVVDVMVTTERGFVFNGGLSVSVTDDGQCPVR
jgi:hypothetical protein